MNRAYYIRDMCQTVFPWGNGMILIFLLRCFQNDTLQILSNEYVKQKQQFNIVPRHNNMFLVKIKGGHIGQC